MACRGRHAWVPDITGLQLKRPVNVVFDFGGVPVDWQPDQLFAQQFPNTRQRELIRRETLSHPDWIEFDRGILSEEEAVKRFAAHTDGSADQFKAFFVAVRNALQPKLETVDILRGLAARGTPLYGLSNMSQSIYE